MLTSAQLKSWAPAIAVATIFILFVALEYGILPALDNGADPVPPTPKTETAVKPVTPPAPTVAPPSSPSPSGAAPENSPVPPATAWSTYHGGTDLCGYSDIVFPELPAKVWQFIAEGPVRQPPVSDSAGIYFVTASGLVVSLDFEGKPRWSKQIESEGNRERVNAPLVCMLGSVFVGAQSGKLFALDAANGETRWTYDVKGEILGSANVFAGPNPPAGAKVFIIERGSGVLNCLDFATGALQWHTDEIARCDGSPGIAGDLLAYGSCASALHGYDAAKGLIARNIPLCDDCQFAGGVAIAGDDAYAGNRSGRIVRANLRTGQIVWTNMDSSTEVFTTPAVGGDLVVVGGEDDGVYGLDRTTGKQRWRFDAKGSPASAIIVGDKVLVTARGALILLRADTGVELWRNEVGDSISSPALVQGRAIVGGEDGTVAAFGAAP